MDGEIGTLARELVNALNRLKPDQINAKLSGIFDIGLTKQIMIASLLQDRQEKGKERWQGMTMSALAEKTGVSKPAVTKIADELEEKGLIERRIYRADRRNTYIVFTERGEKRVGELIEKMNGLLEALSEEIGEEDVRAFIRLCERIHLAICNVAEKQREEHAFTL